MPDDSLTEIIARMWIECDPNRGGDPNEIIPAKSSSGGSNQPTVEYDNPLGGQPRWKWFVPRADATSEYLRKHGYEIVKRP